MRVAHCPQRGFPFLVIIRQSIDCWCQGNWVNRLAYWVNTYTVSVSYDVGDSRIYIGDSPMLLLTLMAFSATILGSAMWIFSRLDQDDKTLFVELFDDNKI